MKKDKSVRFILVMICVIVFFYVCGNAQQSKSRTSSRYSRQYQTDSEYRNSVDKLAEMSGESSEEIDSLIHKFVTVMNSDK